jgi:RNA polymerase sigma-70 factor (ECF subfamily)
MTLRDPAVDLALAAGPVRTVRASGTAATEVDAATLARCRAGDAAAVRTFVLGYQGLVFAFLSRSLGRGPHVEDLAQEVFLRACRALPRLEAERRGGKVSTWLLTIASRVAIDARRKRQIVTTPLDPDLAAPSLGTPETERQRLELGRALEAAAAALTPDHRDVFVLAEFHGLEMREIASVLGVPENTVKTRLFRARAELRGRLEGVWDGGAP